MTPSSVSSRLRFSEFSGGNAVRSTMKLFLLAIAAVGVLTLAGCSHPGFKADNAKACATQFA
jgi:hypothetical protein